MGEDTKIKTNIRGYDVKDKWFFSQSEILRLNKAQQEIMWLLDRDYPISSIITFVGDRYQFSSRQRNAIQRGTCSSKQLKDRKSKEIKIEDVRGNTLNIDGFNFIITLEVAISKGIILNCMDGSVRDLAGLRGTYKLIDKTDIAIEQLGKVLDELRISEVNIYIDAPVSNSGRLKCRIIEISRQWDRLVNVYIVQNPDTILENLENVVSSDAIILDKCKSWINISKYIIEKYINDSWIVGLNILKKW